MTADRGAAAPPDAACAVRMRGIQKRFGAVLANDDVELSVRKGTVHGIVGENGAGKSTLMSVLYGFYRADQGSIEVFGQPVDIRKADDAISHGIGMVHQHFMLVETLSAIDNVMLGAEPHWLLQRATATVRARLNELMQSTGLHVQLDALAGDLSVGDRQRLEILKALYRGARVLILDEPTAVLTPQETQQLFEVLGVLRQQGTTIILITHKLKEVMALCDIVTVMRGGKVVQEVAIAEASIENLAQAMVGRKVNMGRVANAEVRPPGAVLLQTQQIEVRDAWNVVRLSGIDLSLRAGEIVGVAGVSGNGQSELLDVLSGLMQPTAGTLQVGDAVFGPGNRTHPLKPLNPLSPQMARALGIAHVPEDRHARALVMAFVAWESAILGYDKLPRYHHSGWLNHTAMRHATAEMMEHFDVRPRNAELASSKFSGGNQQKLVLARELGQAPHILLVGQPTRGVDIGAIEFIYTQLRAMRDAGCAVLVVSSELDEILALSDRVVVMNQGRIAGELAIAECTEASLGLLMTGGVVH